MLDLKKYYGEMKKLTIAELVLNAVTFFCVLFLFVLPCFTASIGYSPDILNAESENAVQKIFYDKARAALRAELLQGNDPETIIFSFSIVEELKLMISAFRSGYSGLGILPMIYFLIPVMFGVGLLCRSAINAVKYSKRLVSNEIGNATLLFFNDIKAGTDKKKKKNTYEQFNVASLAILIVVDMIFIRWFGLNFSFISHVSGISAVGYFSIFLALIAYGISIYTNQQKKKLKTTLLTADYEDRQAVEAALQHSPFDMNTPAGYASQQPQPPLQSQMPYPPQTPMNGQQIPSGQSLPQSYPQGAQNRQAYYPAQTSAPVGYAPYAQMPAATQPQPTAQPFGETNANEETAAPAAPNDTNKQ